MGKWFQREVVGAAGLPKAPVVYINDPVVDMPHAGHLQDLIPSSLIVFLSESNIPTQSPVQGCDMVASNIRNGVFDKKVAVITENFADSQTQEKIETATLLREEAIKHGCNFVSINLFLEQGTPADDKEKWGTNHLDFCVKDDMDAKEIAQRLFRWLFKVFTVPESLHLIPEDEMTVTDKKALPDYEYCPIKECKFRPKSAKLQIVALVVSKPVVGPGEKLTWTVVDRSGTATFYFQYRGKASQYTWDWILGLQPGERRALPRMPMVKVKERKTVRVVKAPFRTVGFVVQGVGLAVRTVGHGVVKLGETTKMGKGCEWVAADDVVNGKKVNWSAVFKKEGQAKDAQLEKEQNKAWDKIFNEKGQKTWKDDDSIASTAGDDDFYDVNEKVNEKVEEFV